MVNARTLRLVVVSVGLPVGVIAALIFVAGPGTIMAALAPTSPMVAAGAEMAAVSAGTTAVEAEVADAATLAGRGGERRYIAIIDDRSVLAQSLGRALEFMLPNNPIFTYYTNVEDWIGKGAPRYDVFFVDHDMGSDFMRGPAGVRLIRMRWPNSFIIGCSMQEGYGAAFLAAGADAFYLKGESINVLKALMQGG